MKRTVLATSIAIALSCTASAQETASDPNAANPAKAKSRSRLLEEVVVTAQKREEDMSDVPISINAFSSDILDARGIGDPKDLPLVTPGLTLGETAGFTVTYLRGVGSDAYLLADPSVALYIDGIYFPFAHGLAQNFGAIERVEVLKGPQGTLFGRNAVGGAISVVSKRPDVDAFWGEVLASYGSFDRKEIRAHINAPLTDDLAVAVSAQTTSSEFHRDARIAGRPAPDEESDGVRVKLRWAPSDTFDLNLAGFQLEQDGTGTMFATNSEPSELGRAAGIEPQTGYDGEVDFPDVRFGLENTVFYGESNIFTDFADIKLLASKQDVETNSGYDFDGSPQPLAAFEAKRQFANVRSAELQFLSNDGSVASDWLTWIVGAYYFESRQGFDPVVLTVGGLNLTGGNVAGVDLPESGAALVAAMVEAGGAPTGQADAYGIIDTQSIAGFFQLTADVTDWMAITVGGRYQEEEREIFRSQSFLHNTDIPLNGDSAGLGDTTISFKPKVSVDFRPGDDTLIYASFQQAIKSSTYNVINIYDEAEYVEPEEMDAYEIGIKSTLFDGSVQYSAAVFAYDITNLQVQFLSLLQGGAVTFENAGGAEVEGADFDSTVLVLPSLIDDLVLTLGGAYLEGKYTEYVNASGFDESTGALTTDNDYSGNTITRTPRVTANLGLMKTFIIPGGPLEIAADVYHNSGFYYLAQNGAYDEPAHTLVGARVSYLYEDWSLRLSLFGKNITDEQYNYGRFFTDFGKFDSLALPANYGARVNWEF